MTPLWQTRRTIAKSKKKKTQLARNVEVTCWWAQNDFIFFSFCIISAGGLPVNVFTIKIIHCSQPLYNLMAMDIDAGVINFCCCCQQSLLNIHTQHMNEMLMPVQSMIKIGLVCRLLLLASQRLWPDWLPLLRRLNAIEILRSQNVSNIPYFISTINMFANRHFATLNEPER